MKKKVLYIIILVLVILLVGVFFGALSYYKKTVNIQGVSPVVEIKDRKPTQSEINQAMEAVRSKEPITEEKQKELDKAMESVRGTTTTKQVVTPFNQGGAGITPEQRKQIEAAMNGVSR
jgi:uncharacterized membrane protein